MSDNEDTKVPGKWQPSPDIPEQIVVMRRILEDTIREVMPAYEAGLVMRMIRMLRDLEIDMEALSVCKCIFPSLRSGERIDIAAFIQAGKHRVNRWPS